jgi:hypothetical protein
VNFYGGRDLYRSGRIIRPANVDVLIVGIDVSDGEDSVVFDNSSTGWNGTILTNPLKFRLWSTANNASQIDFVSSNGTDIFRCFDHIWFDWKKEYQELRISNSVDAG